MGKASSAKKVSRVARTGGGRTTRRSSGSWGFPMVIALVVVLGVLGVVLSRGERKASADQPTVNDHWHSAYGFYICDKFLPDLPQPPQLIGLHTHGDGIIHIEPQDPILDTGKKATLGRFIGGYPGLKLTSTSITVLNQTWKNGDKCGDKPAEVQVKRNGSAVTGNPSSLRVPKDGWITMAFVPKGATIPAPPNWDARVKKADGAQEGHPTTPTSEGATPTSVPTETPSSVPASAPATTSPPGTPTTKP
jgi:hypothetical protein